MIINKQKNFFNLISIKMNKKFNSYHVSHYFWNHNDLLGEGGFGKVYKGHD